MKMAKSDLLSKATRFGKWASGRKKKEKKIKGLSKAELRHIRSLRGFSKRKKKKKKRQLAQEARVVYYRHLQTRKKTIYNQ